MSERTIENVLREVKDDLLCYCVVCEYGSMDMGLDDTGVSDDERECRIIASPAGFLGGLRVIWQGTVASVEMMDLYRKPKVVGNPPSRDDLVNPKTLHLRRGAFVYGSDDAVRDWPAELKSRRNAR